MNNFFLAYAGWAASAVVVFLWLLWPEISKWLSGHSERHSLYSEIHGLLEVSIRQAAAIVEVRDLVRASQVTVNTGDAAMLLTQIRDLLAAQKSPTLDTQPIATLLGYALKRFEGFDGEKVIALLGQIRDIGGQAAADLTVASGKLMVMANRPWVDPDKVETFMRQFWEHSSSQLEALKHIEALQDFSLLQKQGADQLEALKKLDERLFEFVASTKRIMKAMEGGASDLDDDTIIEEARMIRAKALDRGVDLTLEDSIRRAREQRTYQRG